jgi:hypothetical protein
VRKKTSNFKRLPRWNNTTYCRCLFFKFSCWLKTLPYLQYIQAQVLGSWQQEPKQQPERTAAEALAKFQNSGFSPVTTILVIQFGLIWWIQTIFFGIPYNTMTIPTEQSNILKHILENVVLQQSGGCLVALRLPFNNMAANPSLMSWL